MINSTKTEPVRTTMHISVFAVDHYMYCHPDTVVLRRGRPKVLRWQHLIGVQGLIVQVRHSSSNVGIESLGLYFRQTTFELLKPLKTISQHHCLCVVWLDTWISFKWITRKGNTQFQVKLAKIEDARRLVYLLQQSGCRIDRVSSKFLTREKALAVSIDRDMKDDLTLADDHLTFRKAHSQNLDMSQHNGQALALQLDHKCLQQNHLSLSPGVWPRHETSQYPGQDMSQTQINSIWNDATSVMSVKSVTSLDLARDDGRANAPSESSISISTSTHSRLTSLFDTSSSFYVSRPDRVSEDSSSHKLVISSLIQHRHSLHLELESYAFADLRNYRGSTKERLKWYHVGLVSDLYLSLVPASGSAAQPLVVLTRAANVLAEFVPHRGYLKAYCGEGILGLRQRDTRSDCVVAHAQLHMKGSNLSLVCQWLEFWDIHIENRDEPILATESTYINRGYSRPWSVHSRKSDYSRASRYSLRQSRVCSDAQNYTSL